MVKGSDDAYQTPKKQSQYAVKNLVEYLMNNPELFSGTELQ